MNKEKIDPHPNSPRDHKGIGKVEDGEISDMDKVHDRPSKESIDQVAYRSSDDGSERESEEPGEISVFPCKNSHTDAYDQYRWQELIPFSLEHPENDPFIFIMGKPEP